jgi:hypothetical protein
MIVTIDNWSSVAQQIAYPGDAFSPDENAVKRAVALLGPSFYQMDPIPETFKLRNRIRCIDFVSSKDRDFYNAALSRWMRADMEARAGLCSFALMRIEDLKLRQAAETLKAPIMADLLFNQVAQGFSAVAGVCFKDSLVEIVNNLVHKKNVDPKSISILWGGFTAKERQRKAAEQEVSSRLTESQIKELIDDDLYDEVLATYGQSNKLDLSAIDKKLLCLQTAETRDGQVQKFQSNRAKYCIFTLPVGREGLNLHDETGTAPRRGVYGLCYSDKATVQIVRRIHRVTSKSDTFGEFLAFNDTRDINVAMRVSEKLKALRHSSAGNFDDLLFTNKPNDDFIEDSNLV